MADDSWRTHSFRQNIVAKIDEAIRQSGMNTSRNSIEMENHVFQKAKNKEEYLGFVARLILHVREMNSKKGQPGPMNGVPGGQQQQAPGMPDPINALQNLASQGSRNAMVNMGGPNQPGQMGGPGQGASNLLQTLNRGPGGQQIMMPGNMPLQDSRNENEGVRRVKENEKEEKLDQPLTSQASEQPEATIPKKRSKKDFKSLRAPTAKHAKRALNANSGGNNTPVMDETLNIMKSIQSRRMDDKDEYSLYGEQVGIKIRKLTSARTRFMVQNIINNALFEAEMGMYDEDPATATNAISPSGA